jgi:hypothetical protein
MSEERKVSEDANADGQDTRRDALMKMGKYAAYTAPVLMSLTLPGKSHAGRRHHHRVHTSPQAKNSD